MTVPYRIPLTTSDIQIANAIAKYASPRAERAAELLSWGADEHVLVALAAGWWLYCRGRRFTLPARTNSYHIPLTTLVVSAVPHLLKSVFDQWRPDRLTVRGHLHGVPLSGKPLDAFPSGHAMHVGALLSAATVLSRAKRNFVWTFGAGLALARIVLAIGHPGMIPRSWPTGKRLEIVGRARHHPQRGWFSQTQPVSSQQKALHGDQVSGFGTNKFGLRSCSGYQHRPAGFPAGPQQPFPGHGVYLL